MKRWSFLLTLCGFFSLTLPAGALEFSLGLGGEMNRYTRDGIALGGVLAADWRLSPGFATGVRGVYSTNFDLIKNTELVVFVRWYPDLHPFGESVQLFLQEGTGAAFAREPIETNKWEVGDLRHDFVVGLGAGARISLSDHLYLETLLRGGYPYLFATTILMGYTFGNLPRSAAPRTGGAETAEAAAPGESAPASPTTTVGGTDENGPAAAAGSSAKADTKPKKEPKPKPEPKPKKEPKAKAPAKTQTAPAPVGQVGQLPGAEATGQPSGAAVTPGTTVVPGAIVPPVVLEQADPLRVVYQPPVIAVDDWGVVRLAMRSGDMHQFTLAYIFFPADAADFAGLPENMAANNERFMDGLILFLQEHPGYQVRLRGHANYIGDDPALQREYRSLGLRRANTVLEQLAAKGVSRRLMSTATFGETDPRAGYRDTDNWWKNRRVEVELFLP